MSHTQKILEEVIHTPQRRISERTEELIVDLFMQQIMREILSGIMDTPKQRLPERIAKQREILEGYGHSPGTLSQPIEDQSMRPS